LHLNVLDGLYALTHERRHSQKRRHDQDHGHSYRADQGCKRGPEAMREPHIGGIGNDDYDNGPAECGQKRLEDQEREVCENGDNAVKKYGTQAFLRALVCAQ